MEKIEFTDFYRKPSIVEKSAMLEANQPLLKIEEEQGIVKAQFCIELSGVSVKRDDQGCQDRKCREHGEINTRLYKDFIIPWMKNNQQIELIYIGGRDDNGNGFIGAKIRGSATGKGMAQTVESVKELWTGLNIILENLKEDYHFTPTYTNESYHDKHQKDQFVYSIMPMGLELSGQKGHIGFGPLTDGKGYTHETIILPVNSLKSSYYHLDAFVAGFRGCPDTVSLIIQIQPVKLTQQDLLILNKAIQCLRKSGYKSIRHPLTKTIDIQDEKLLDVIEGHILLWLRNPRGYRLSCKVISNSKVPHIFLRMIGHELFNGCEVCISCSKPDNIATGNRQAKIDLKNCFNISSGYPPLLPSVPILRDAGFKRHYTQQNLNLSKTGTMLGVIKDGWRDKVVRINKEDRNRHIYIIGSSGTGKSTLLYNMILQDMKNDEGFCLIDPHGDLYRDVLNSIPFHRAEDVVLFDVCDFERAAGINFLECSGRYKTVQMNFIINELIMIFDRLYDLRETGGPIFEQYMRNALLLIMDNEIPDATLMDISLVFEEREYREFLIKNCRNELVKNFWMKQAEKVRGENSLENMGPYITSKLNQFTYNPLLRPIISQPKSTINFREIMDSGKILLVNLAKGLLSELDVSLLGMLIIGKIFSSAMSRIETKRSERRPYTLYVDEFQNFITDTIAHLMSESRKFGISLILANQTLTQLSAHRGLGNIIDAVLGNVGNILTFRLGVADAHVIEVFTKPHLHAQDLLELPDFHVAARLLTNNYPQKPFVFKTLPTPEITVDSTQIIDIIRSSKDKYTVSTDRVEKDIITKKRYLY